MMGFIIWTLVVLIFVIIGVRSLKAREAVGFFTFAKVPDIPDKNVKSYNHSIAVIWFIFSAVLEVLGIPLLIAEQNSPYFIIPILGTMFLVIGIMAAYFKVEKHYKSK